MRDHSSSHAPTSDAPTPGRGTELPPRGPSVSGRSAWRTGVLRLLPVPVLVTLGTAATTSLAPVLEGTMGDDVAWDAVGAAVLTVVASAALSRWLVEDWLRAIGHPVHRRPLGTGVVVAIVAGAALALTLRPSNDTWFTAWLAAMAMPALWTAVLDGTRPARLALRVVAGLVGVTVGFAAAVAVVWTSIAAADAALPGSGGDGTWASVTGLVGVSALLLAWSLATAVGFAICHAAVLAVPPAGGYGSRPSRSDSSDVGRAVEAVA